MALGRNGLFSLALAFMRATSKVFLSANSKEDLLAQLRAMDLTVPLVTEGRKKEHREAFMIARLLSTMQANAMLAFPMQVTWGDPQLNECDFLFSLNGRAVGVECVEAVPQQAYEKEVIREKHYPECMNFVQKFDPQRNGLSANELHEVASGQRAESPWTVRSMEENWLAAIQYFIRSKTEKLRSGNYNASEEVWLLVRDEWPNPIRFYPSQHLEAARRLANFVNQQNSSTEFDAIYLESENQIFRYESARFSVQPVADLWRGS